MPDALIPCCACGAMVPDVEGPTHRYMASSPGCWAIYGEVLAREYSNALYAKNHRLTVDAFAVQHPGQPSRQAIRSVCLHLCSLCAVHEHGVPPHQATALLQELADRVDYEWLEPPSSLGVVTVADVHATSNPEAHLREVEAWAHSAWSAWRAHKDKINAWIGTVL